MNDRTTDRLLKVARIEVARFEKDTAVTILLLDKNNNNGVLNARIPNADPRLLEAIQNISEFVCNQTEVHLRTYAGYGYVKVDGLSSKVALLNAADVWTFHSNEIQFMDEKGTAENEK